MKLLENKHILITWAASGIWEAIAKTCAMHWAKICITDIDEENLLKVEKEIRDTYDVECHAHVADLRDETSVQNMLQEVENHGQLDVVINNAWVMVWASPLQEFQTKDFKDLIDNNIYSVFHVTKHVLPYLHKNLNGWLVLFTGSVSWIIGQPSEAPYAGTKAFIHAFAKTVAIEQAAFWIRANVVAPWPIDTQMTRPEHGTLDDESAEMIVNSNPMGRRGSPWEIAETFAFLCSDWARYINAEVITVDGWMVNGIWPVGKQASEKLSQKPELPINLSNQHDWWNAES